jgi:hypothetical protein
MANRPRILKARPGQLKAQWATYERGSAPCISYAWGGDGADKTDGRILSSALEGVAIHGGKSLAEELEARGYDLTTLKFSIEMKKV